MFLICWANGSWGLFSCNSLMKIHALKLNLNGSRQRFSGRPPKQHLVGKVQGRVLETEKIWLTYSWCWKLGSLVGRNRVIQLLTLAKLLVLVPTSFIELIKLLQNLIKILPNYIMVWYKFYYKFISDIIVNYYTTKKILKSWYIFKILIYFIFNWSVYHLIFSTKSGTSARVRIQLASSRHQTWCMLELFLPH